MKKILFMCVANSARSQLAEGLAKKILGNRFEVQSAGSKPGKLNPFAVQVMQELNLDISKNYSKSVDDLSDEFKNGLNYIITLCADEVCPVLLAPKAQKLHWPFTDPATQEELSQEEHLQRFRDARDSIQTALQKFKFENNL